MEPELVKPVLPFINLKTTIGNFPFLIDTGANINLIDPKLAWSYNISRPYNFSANQISSANGNFDATSAIDINFFYPKINFKTQFLLHKFHPFFRGIIGTGILKALNATIDMKKMTLTLCRNSEELVIPLQEYIPQKQIANNVEQFRTCHLTSSEKKKLEEVLNANKTAFHEPNSKLTYATKIECTINTTDDIPVHQRVYPYPAAYTEEVNKQIKKLLEDGIIRPSRSAWTAPVWVVPKKTDASGEKKFRMVIDYRKINEKTTSDRYPMPEISYVIDQLKGQKYFSTLDLASGFHQIKMKDDDIQKTAFSINNGKYEFTRMPFGLKNAPATFQRAIDDVLREHIGKICYVYIDDVIVFGKTLEEHLVNLNIILNTLNRANFKIQLDKSEFLHSDVEFLGYIISSEGIKPNHKKIEVIRKFPEPKTIKDLKSFLGMMSYYRRFVKDFAKIAKPLTNLLRGERNPMSSKKIYLCDTEKQCFNKMKNILSSSDVLIYPDYEKPFLLTTDASDFAIGAVLSQGEMGRDKPIHFASRTLSVTEEKFSVPEKEMLAIYWALQTFRNYLYGTKFKILTDHQPLTFALSPKNTNAKLKRWKSYLEEHDYEIMYKPGKTNVVADALSRMVCSMTKTQRSADTSDDFYIISTEVPINAFRHQVIIKNGPNSVIVEHPFESYTRITITIADINENSILQILKTHFNIGLVNGLLTDEDTMGKIQETYRKYFGQQRLLKIRFTQKQLEDVQDENEQWNVVRNEHMRAHRCVQENKLQIMRKFYFPKLHQKLRDFIVNCRICNENKYDRNPIKYPLQKTPIPNAPFQIAHVDILFLESNHFLTYIDKFSKFAQVMHVQSRAAIDIVPALKELLSKYKPPDILVMDGEKSFMTGDLVNYYNGTGITPYITATGRSEMNGTVERLHSTLLELYRITKTENPTKPLIELMHMVLHKYNSSIHTATKFTPYEIILPSPQTPEIIEKVFENLKRKQKQDLDHHNKSKKIRNPKENSEAFEKTRQRLKHKARYKKVKIAKVNNSTITTDDGRKIHKNDIKIREI